MTTLELSPQESAGWASLASLRLPINPQDILDAFGSVQPLFKLSPLELQARLPWRASVFKRLSTLPSLETSLAAVERMSRRGIQLIPFPDARYPTLLRRISSPPAALWCRGEPAVLSAPYLAVVGPRLPSSYGLEVTRFFVSRLARAGLGIVSGGARGVDAEAHRVAMENGAASLAVFGTGIDVAYPRDHASLFEALAARGACVSEFAPGTSPRPEHFPIRNRLISGLSLGTLVVEAGDKSGALITARFALDQNRDVFAVPGSIFVSQSVGVHRLLKEGARLVTTPEEILTELHLQLEHPLPPNRVSPAPPLQLTLQQSAVLQALGAEPCPVDVLIAATGLEGPIVLEVLMFLELEGLVQQLPGQQFRRVAASRL